MPFRVIQWISSQPFVAPVPRAARLPQAELSINLPAGAGVSIGTMAGGMAWPWGGSGSRNAGEKRLENIFAADSNADSELVERCLTGDEAAWESLVRLHTKRVYSIAYRFTGSDTQAQDLTQDVFQIGRAHV